MESPRKVGKPKNKPVTVLPRSLQSSKAFFSDPGKHRTHIIIVQGKKLYVNPSNLAEHSEYFDACFFGDYRESAENAVVLEEEKLEDVLILLNAIGANPNEGRTEINVSNCARLLRLADKLIVVSLQKRCRSFLEKDFCHLSPTLEETIEILVACELANMNGSPIHNVASRLAGFGKEELKANNVHKLVTSPSLSAALFLAADGEQSTKHRNIYGGNCTTVRHQFGYGGTSQCSVLECNQELGKVCGTCHFSFCELHEDFECPRQGNKTKVKLVPWKCGWKELDKDFL